MRIVVIGAGGHVGGYLVPDLVERGHEVVAITRGSAPRYRQDPAWDAVERVTLDREAEDAAGTLGSRILELRPDVVVDMICFDATSATALADALRGRVAQLVHVGTVWIHGSLTAVPAREDDAARNTWGAYGLGKAAAERALLAQSRAGGVPTAIVHPGHISGPGWRIINPQANAGLSVWGALARGEEVLLPGLGLETVHHVHAADVAQLIRLCIEQPEAARHEAFYAVSEQALTLRGFAEAVAGWYGREARIRFTSMEEFQASLAEEDRAASFEHIARSHAMSIEKGRRLLGYSPARTSLETVAESVAWLTRNGELGPDMPAPHVGGGAGAARP